MIGAIHDLDQLQRRGRIMSTLTDRFMAAATRKPRRVSTMSLIAIATVVALAAGLAYGRLPPAASGLPNEAIPRVSTELRVLDEHWRGARNPSAIHRSTSWRVECISDYDPYREAREIARRVEAGERVTVGCLQTRFVRE
jgi:hypothetical protein